MQFTRRRFINGAGALLAAGGNRTPGRVSGVGAAPAATGPPAAAPAQPPTTAPASASPAASAAPSTVPPAAKPAAVGRSVPFSLSRGWQRRLRRRAVTRGSCSSCAASRRGDRGREADVPAGCAAHRPQPVRRPAPGQPAATASTRRCPRTCRPMPLTPALRLSELERHRTGRHDLRRQLSRACCSPCATARARAISSRWPGGSIRRRRRRFTPRRRSAATAAPSISASPPAASTARRAKRRSTRSKRPPAAPTPQVVVDRRPGRHAGHGLADGRPGRHDLRRQQRRACCSPIAPNGSVKWTAQTGATIKSAPALGTDGTVYHATSDGKMYAVSPQGQVEVDLRLRRAPRPDAAGDVRGRPARRWRRRGERHRQRRVADRRSGWHGLYRRQQQQHVRGARRTASMKWLFEAERELAGIWTTPVLSADGSTLYFGANKGGVYALNAGNGSAQVAVPRVRVDLRVVGARLARHAVHGHDHRARVRGR